MIFFSHAQTPASIYAKASAAYVPMNDLDGLSNALSRMDGLSLTTDEQKTFLECHKLIAQHYVNNYHFKQSADVLQRYLTIKESILKNQLIAIVDSTNKNINTRKQKINEGIGIKESQISSLQADISSLENSNGHFKKYFSIGIIALVVLFALVLLRFSLQAGKARAELKKNQEQMKANANVALLGKFEEAFKS